MREIKFRGKAETGWLYSSLIQTKELTAVVDAEAMSSTPIDRIGLEMVMREVDKKTIGQYTGQKDSKGNEIFEGDILELVSPIHPNQVTIGVVEWSERESLFRIEHRKGIYDMSTYDSHALCHFPWIVIGNIHDNPKLLK